MRWSSMLTDQRRVLQQAGKQLVYHTAAYQKATDIAGAFKLSAWIAIDQPDTDFYAYVSEIQPDGTAVFLSDDLLRARYRGGNREAQLVPKGSVVRYDFDKFMWVARRIQAGSRLRLVIEPVNSMYNEKNYNAGGVVAEETGKDARKVTVSLYHDAQRASALFVPIAAPAPAPVKKDKSE